MATVAAESQAEGLCRLQTDTVCLDVLFRKPALRKRTPITDDMVIDAERDAMRLSKEILRSSNYRRLSGVAAACRNWLCARALPSPLKRGTYLLPLTLLDESYRKLEEFRNQFDVAVGAFIGEYENRKADARQRLHSLYDETDYPPVADLQAAFGMSWRLITFGLPGETVLGDYCYAIEKAKAEQEWLEATAEVQDALRVAMRDLVGHLADRLTPAGDGKRKRFKDATVLGLIEFLDLFDHRNLTGDDQMEGLVGQARGLLAGRSANELRTNEGLRQSVREGMEGVGRNLDALLVDAPRRRVRVDDE